MRGVHPTKVITFSLLAFTAMACSQVKKDTPSTTQNKNIEIVRSLFRHFNTHDWQSMANLYSDTAEFIDPSFGQDAVYQTRAQIIDKYKQLATVFPDVSDSIITTYLSGEKNVVVEFISSGTAPNSVKWTLPICTIFTIENGLIMKDHTYYDNN
jgi:ketosteroid isomerase-like protein